MDTEFVATQEGQRGKSIVAQRRGKWEGIWVAGYMPSERQLLGMRENEGEIREWMPRSILAAHRVSPDQTSVLDAMTTFTRYTCAAVHSLYGQEGRESVDLLVARTLPQDENELEKTRTRLRRYLHRPGGRSHKRLSDYGELVCCIRAAELPTYESFQERLEGIAKPGTYLSRRHLDAQQMLPILLGVYRVDREDAISPDHWEHFLEPRRSLIAESVKILESQSDGAHMVSQLLEEARFMPIKPEWHSRFYRLDPLER
jgi:hypothetical protein